MPQIHTNYYIYTLQIAIQPLVRITNSNISHLILQIEMWLKLAVTKGPPGPSFIVRRILMNSTVADEYRWRVSSQELGVIFLCFNLGIVVKITGNTILFQHTLVCFLFTSKWCCVKMHGHCFLNLFHPGSNHKVLLILKALVNQFLIWRSTHSIF